MERPTFLLGKEQTVADGEIVKLLLRLHFSSVQGVSWFGCWKEAENGVGCSEIPCTGSLQRAPLQRIQGYTSVTSGVLNSVSDSALTG